MHRLEKIKYIKDKRTSNAHSMPVDEAWLRKAVKRTGCDKLEVRAMPIQPSAGPNIVKVMLLPFTAQDTVQLVPKKVWNPLHVAVSRGSTSNIHTYEKVAYLKV